MNKQIITIIFGIFLLTSVSAIYGGETKTITFDFEPVACSTDEGVTFNINSYNVNITPSLNFLGDFTLTCFSGEEKIPTIQYVSSGGSRTKYIYENITEYNNATKYIDKIIEIPGKNNTIEKFIEISSKRTNTNIFVICLLLVILGLILWNFKKSKEKRNFDNYNYRIEKGGENKNE